MSFGTDWYRETPLIVPLTSPELKRPKFNQHERVCGDSSRLVRRYDIIVARRLSLVELRSITERHSVGAFVT